MSDYDPATYGDRMAEIYDGWFGTPGNADAAATFLLKWRVRDGRWNSASEPGASPSRSRKKASRCKE